MATMSLGCGAVAAVSGAAARKQSAEARRRKADRKSGISIEQAGGIATQLPLCDVRPRDGMLAEREGFEPSIRFCRILTFQASAFDHSATAPLMRWKGAHLEGKRRAGKVAAPNSRP